MTNDKAPMGAAQRRVLQLLLVLAGHEIEGLRLTQVAQALRVPTPMALRDLRVMAEEGWAERIPGHEERWRLGPKPVQIALSHQRGMSELRRKLDEISQRYSRDPK